MEEAELIDKLEHREIRPTAMRILILNAISKSISAVSLQDLEDTLGTVDKSTIFRTLVIFRDHHLIHEIDDGSGSLKYSLCSDECECVPDDQHAHFFCEECHRTYCLKQIHAPIVNLPNGFFVNSINYVLKGICQECSRKKGMTTEK